MGLHTSRVDRCLSTIWAIASSRYVESFVIGYTARSAFSRFHGYRPLGFDHIVILADRMNRSNALMLEQRLQEECKKGNRRAGPYVRKYHPDYRHISYRASAGQGTVCAPEELLHSVYMAWIEPFPNQA